MACTNYWNEPKAFHILEIKKGRIDINYSHLRKEILKGIRGKSLSKKISKLQMRADMSSSDQALLNEIPNQMTIQFNMFGAFVKHQVGNNM